MNAMNSLVDQGLTALMVRRMLAIAAVLLSLSLSAAPVNWSNVPMTVKFKDQPLAGVIETIMNHNGLPVVVSEGVKGSVSLTATRSAKALFEELSNLYNLDWSYDGGVVSVIPARERVTKLIDSKGISVADLTKALTQLQIADPRIPLRSVDGTNIVSVSSTPRYASVVEEAIKMIATQKRAELKPDPPMVLSQEEERTIAVFKLEHATAADVTLDGGQGTAGARIPGVASVMRETLDQFRNVPTNAASRLVGLADESSLRRTLRTALSASEKNPTQENLLAILGASPEQAIRQTERDRPHGTIIADARTNSVFVYDVPSRMANYQALVKSLDVPVRQIEIEVMVIDISEGFSEEFSVRWRALRDSQGRNAASAGTQLLSDVTSASAGLTLARGAFERLMLDIRLQEAKGQAQVVTRPRVITRDGIEAQFSTTDSFHLRLLGKETVDTREISTGMVLKVRPRVVATSPIEAVELSLYFQDGEFSSVAIDGIPVQRRTQLTTIANVLDHHTLVVGGHLFERNERGTERTPYLADLPVLGALFRSTNGSSLRRERLIFITPRIMRVVAASDLQYSTSVLERIIR